MYRLLRGKLTVTGRRLDAPAPAAQGYYDLEGYGDSGFQSGGVYFPSEGCWEITARVADASLTFVTLVVKVPFDPLWPHWLPDKFLIDDLQISRDPWSIQNVFRSSESDDGEIIVETTQSLNSHGDSENRESETQGKPYPEEATHKVMVHGVMGVCVHGAWDDRGEWHAGEGAGVLEWTARGFNYRIIYSGLGLTCQDLLRIAGPISTTMP